MSSKAYRDSHREQVSASKKAYYAKHRTRELAKEKARREANREEYLARRKALYAARRDEILAINRCRYAADPERVRARNRSYRKARLNEYRERDKAYAKAYQQRDPERFREKLWRGREKRRATIRGVFVDVIDSKVVFERDGAVCGICCGLVDPAGKWHIDHVIPLSKGGVHSYANVQLAHAQCNYSKHAKMPDQMLVYGAS